MNKCVFKTIFASNTLFMNLKFICIHKGPEYIQMPRICQK